MSTMKEPNGHSDVQNLADRENRTAPPSGEMFEVLCGPLLNYRGMSNADSATPTWHGSVLIVTNPGDHLPVLQLDQLASQTTSNRPLSNGAREAGAGNENVILPNSSRICSTVKLYSDQLKAFWRFDISVPVGESETRWQYSLSNARYSCSRKSKQVERRTFVVPGLHQSMRIMFHSCNGFSVGTDEAAWSGPALWNDVLRFHKEKPFHVMVGGGDQIYNDGIRVTGPLEPWTSIHNPLKRQKHPFGEELSMACDKFYCDNYIRWFSTEPFATANGQIPQVNIWDDHDIIDGYGSYTHHFMQCAVFRGIGRVAFRYYCLFQHHIPPPRTTFKTDIPRPISAGGSNVNDEKEVIPPDTYIYVENKTSPSYIVGRTPGPYIGEHSRSLYMRFGARVAFLGIDARTERTRKQVNYNETYDLIFNRAHTELAASAGTIKHLIILLGIPIAYPRLQWLENLLTSPLVAPIRLLNKRFGFGGSLFNNFDGQVDILDDLDDHYTARHHKKERKELMLRMQRLASDHSVRISILGGDVHQAATGRFYANPKLETPPERDHRYMVNVISSAITNEPPPTAVANFLAKRNFIHHLDEHTDETLLAMFDRDPGQKGSTTRANKYTMPSRNYAIITETEDAHPQINGNGNGMQNSQHHSTEPPNERHHIFHNGHYPLSIGEEGAGTTHAAATGLGAGCLPSGLDVCIRVEVDRGNKEGGTRGYGFSIPALESPAMPKITLDTAPQLPPL